MSGGKVGGRIGEEAGMRRINVVSEEYCWAVGKEDEWGGRVGEESARRRGVGE